MSTSKFKIIAEETTQPLAFNFNSENLAKAKQIIKWEPKLTIDESIKLTVEWYKQTIIDGIDPNKITKSQIHSYMKKLKF